MRVPIVCVDTRVRQFALAFAGCFSRPQYRHFVIVLVGLLLCHGPRTLTGLLRSVQVKTSLASLSRFLTEAPWKATDLAQTWRKHFDAQLAPWVAQRHADHRAARPKRRGRPKASIVTGYLIGDDSTCHKQRGKKMEGIGRHYSTTAGRPVKGHSLVQSLYVLGGRRCPLAPQLYRQKKVCAAEGVPFRSKIDLMEATIRTFVALAHTRTHVLLDAWYCAKAIWKAARERGFLITTGLKSNRSIRIADETEKRGWRWQDLASYAASLNDADYQEAVWPRQDGSGRTVWVHVLRTVVQNLYRAQVIIVREMHDGKLSEARFWA